MFTFTTPHIHATTLVPADADAVYRIFEANSSLLPLLDRTQNPKILTERFMQSTNLPHGGSPDNLHNLLLHSHLQTIGILSVYMGYPRQEIAYIGELFLHPEARGQGLGSESYRGLEAELRKLQYAGVRAGVSLKNWRALRFWIRQGFLAITGISGDQDFKPDAYAYLELHKRLIRKDGFS